MIETRRLEFGRFVMVDWSAAQPPNVGPNSIWIAARTDDGDLMALENPPDQVTAMSLLGELCDVDTAVLVGWDLCFGFPRGLAAMLSSGPVERGWRTVWKHCALMMADDMSNTWAVATAINDVVGAETGPFWGGVIVRTKPAFPVLGLDEWRGAERAAIAAGRRPTSPWQAAYAGAVGLQSLTGIARLERWRKYEPRLHIWPFDTGFGPPRAKSTHGHPILAAEVYPAMFAECDITLHPVRDARQVLETSAAMVAASSSGLLEQWLAPRVTGSDRDAALDDEGWILGVAAPTGI